MTYRPLFLLNADTASICEIKRLDVQSDNPGDVYFWLYFDRVSRQLSHLTFVSMSANSDEQQRKFAQGWLRFNANTGTYTPTGPGPALARRWPCAPWCRPRCRPKWKWPCLRFLTELKLLCKAAAAYAVSLQAADPSGGRQPVFYPPAQVPKHQAPGPKH